MHSTTESRGPVLPSSRPPVDPPAAEPHSGFTDLEWRRCHAIARRISRDVNYALVSSEDLVVGALLRASSAGIEWARLSVPLVCRFLRFELLATKRRARLERATIETLPDLRWLAAPAEPLPKAEVEAPETNTAIDMNEPARLLELHCEGRSWNELAAERGVSATVLRKRVSRWRKSRYGCA